MLQLSSVDTLEQFLNVRAYSMGQLDLIKPNLRAIFISLFVA
jgi:hypothetical protein